MNTQVISLKEKLHLFQQNLRNGLFAFLFRPPSEDRVSRFGNFLFLALVYLGGLFHWAWLINFGKVKQRYIDWQMFYDFYQATQTALIENSIPFFMSYYYKGTNQFLAIPATDLSPTIFLLKFFSVEDFFLTQMIVVYSLGFWGCLWLKNKYQWSLVAFSVCFLLFNFNGHITSHLAVGHWSWIAYFLLPFFVGWVLSLVEGDVSGSGPIRLTLILSGILLLGGLHPFVWCLLFLILLVLFRRQYWKPVLTGVALALALSTYRILPAAITFWGYKNPFMHGFPSLSVVLSSLVSIYQSPEIIQDMKYVKGSSMPWWEVDHYISILGVGFVMYFGFWRRWKDSESLTNYGILNLPMLIIVVLSFGAIFGFVSQMPLPLISVERTPSRFFIIPLLILLVLSCIWMQKMLDHLRPGWVILVLGIVAIVFEGSLLMEHSSVWYAHASNYKLDTELLQNIEPISKWAKSVEALYVLTVKVSYLVSLLTLIALFAGTRYFKMKGPAMEEVGKVQQ